MLFLIAKTTFVELIDKFSLSVEGACVENGTHSSADILFYYLHVKAQNQVF